MQKIIPFLWFDNNAEEAVNFYISIFKNSKINNITYYGDAAAKVSGRPKGSVMTISFQLNGQQFEALNDGVLYNKLRHRALEHAKQFTWDICAKKTIEVYQKVVESRQ